MALAIDTDPDTDPEDTPFPELNAIRCRKGQKPVQAFALPAIPHSHKTGTGRATGWAGGVAHTPLGVKKSDLWFDLCRKVGEGRALQGGMAQAIERGRS